MTTEVPYFTQLQSAFTEFDEYLSADGDALIRFFIEEGILEADQVQNILDKVNEFFNWMLEIIKKFEGMVITVDGLLGLAEACGSLLKYLLKLIQSINTNGIPGGLDSVLGNLPNVNIDVDMEELGSVMPDEHEIQNIKITVEKLIEQTGNLSSHTLLTT